MARRARTVQPPFAVTLIKQQGGIRSDAIETNPFDNLSALRLDQSYADTVGVKKLLTTVRVRKPNRQGFVKVHPDSAYRLTPAAMIEVKEDREAYLVTPHMAQASAGGGSENVRPSWVFAALYPRTSPLRRAKWQGGVVA